MRIVILEDYSDSFRTLGFDRQLTGHDLRVFTDPAIGPDAIVDRLKGAEAAVLINQRLHMPGSVVERLAGLSLISQTGRRLSHIDLAACDRMGIVVSAGVGARSNPTIELTWGLIISMMRHIPQQSRRLLEGSWQDAMGTELYGKTLGVYGLGKIGTAVATVGRAFGMQVVAWGRPQSHERLRAAGFEVAANRDSFFRMADVLTIHLPLNAETRGLITRQDLARMKPDSLFVNTSRADIVAPGALAGALAAGRPGRAAVDVYEEEPVLNTDHALLRLPNALCTPHLGYAVRETYEAMFSGVVDQVRAFADGGPINVVSARARALMA